MADIHMDKNEGASHELCDPMETPSKSSTTRRKFDTLSPESDSASPDHKKTDTKVTNEDLRTLFLEQFLDLKSDLKSTRSELTRDIAELRDELNQRDLQIVNLEGNLRMTQSDLEKANSKIMMQGDAIDTLEKTLDELEQHGRRWALRISGLVLGNTSDYRAVVVKLAADIKVDLKLADIDRAHPVGSNKNMLIARFTNYTARSKLFDARRRLKGRQPAVYINEDLTKTRFAILKSLLRLRAQKKITNVWSKDGRIFISCGNNDKTIIQSMADISKLHPQDPVDPAD